MREIDTTMNGNGRFSGTALALALATGATVAHAECGIEEGSVRILSNDFEALHIVAERAEECAGGAVNVTKDQTTEHKTLQVPALSVNPASYTVAIVANNSIVPLLNDDLVRPLDELVEKYGQDLSESQLIRIDGRVMAIAFMANAQHLYYREDLLEEVGLEVPKSYEAVLEAAETLRETGGIEAPLAATLKPGWDLAAEFVNMYMGLDGEFFEPGSAVSAIENDEGVLALETIKRMTDYMDPDYLTFDTNEIKPYWEAGEVALMNGWGSRASAFIDEEAPDAAIAASTRFAAAPTVGGGSTPAAALWWDGFTIARNITDVDAEASFRAMMHALSPDVLEEHAEVAVWLIDGYEPTPAAAGVFATIEAGARPYPMLPYMGLLHTALGDNLSEFLQGRESAEQALSDVTRAYTTAARSEGYIE